MAILSMKELIFCFQSGVLVAVVRGANVPLLSSTLVDQLKQEHKVLDGSADRKEVSDFV